MKQLFKNGNSTTLFFSETSTFDDVFEWVQEQVMFSDDNLFNLSEQHSCSVNNSGDGDIWVSGDEDSITLTIEKLTPIL